MNRQRSVRALHVARKYTAFARGNLRQRGWIRVLNSVISEVVFDFRHGLWAALPRETDVDGIPPERAGDAVQYQGVDPRIAGEALGRLPATALEATFVDYGCGKGRGLALGAVAGFRRLIGIEISPVLAAICDRNLRRTRHRHSGIIADVRVADAVEFRPPAGPLVAFLYNPFLGETLERVVARLRQHSEYHPVWVVYINPMGLSRFMDGGFTVSSASREGGHLVGVNLVPLERNRGQVENGDSLRL
jgi:SAM-dependent methyltransferase